jgi:hypothetical protein
MWNVWKRKEMLQLLGGIEALRYKQKGRGFDSQWCHGIFFIDVILPTALLPWG